MDNHTIANSLAEQINEWLPKPHSFKIHVLKGTDDPLTLIVINHKSAHIGWLITITVAPETIKIIHHLGTNFLFELSDPTCIETIKSKIEPWLLFWERGEKDDTV